MYYVTFDINFVLQLICCEHRVIKHPNRVCAENGAENGAEDLGRPHLPLFEFGHAHSTELGSFLKAVNLCVNFKCQFN